MQDAMPQCNRCKYQNEIEKLEVDRKRLAGICGKCRGPCDDAHEGKTFISFEAAKDSQQILKLAPEYVPGGTRRELQLVDVPQDVRDKMLNVIRAFADLSPAESIIVCLMLKGVGLKKIAEQLGLSKQHLWLYWKKLIRRRPIWYEIRTGMIGVRKGGRKPGEVYGNKRGDKFLERSSTWGNIARNLAASEIGMDLPPSAENTPTAEAQKVE